MLDLKAKFYFKKSENNKNTYKMAHNFLLIKYTKKVY